MNGETFEYSNWRFDRDLESTIPDIKKRKALVALMGKNECPICVLIIPGNPSSFKASHTLLHMVVRKHLYQDFLKSSPLPDVESSAERSQGEVYKAANKLLPGLFKTTRPAFLLTCSQ